MFTLVISCLTTSNLPVCQIHGETMEMVTDFIFLGSKITADGDCSHEIKRRFSLGRKAMINLNSILKSRDITLLTKAHLAKAMLFPVVMYGCELDHKESWAPKNWCIWLVVLEKTLESPLDCMEIQPVNPKGNQSWMFIGRTDVEAETPILWPPDAKNWVTGKDPDARKDWRQDEKEMTEDEMVGWHNHLYEHDFEHAPGHNDGQGSPAWCSPWGHKESDMTEPLNWLNLPWFMDLTFQIPMQYCSLQHQTLLPSPVTSTTGCCFCFGSASSFFPELLLCCSPVQYWAPTDLEGSSFSVLFFCLFIMFMGFSRLEYWSGLPFPSPVDHILSGGLFKRLSSEHCFLKCEASCTCTRVIVALYRC